MNISPELLFSQFRFYVQIKRNNWIFALISYRKLITQILNKNSKLKIGPYLGTIEVLAIR